MKLILKNMGVNEVKKCNANLALQDSELNLLQGINNLIKQGKNLFDNKDMFAPYLLGAINNNNISSNDLLTLKEHVFDLIHNEKNDSLMFTYTQLPKTAMEISFGIIEGNFIIVKDGYSLENIIDGRTSKFGIYVGENDKRGCNVRDRINDLKELLDGPEKRFLQNNGIGGNEFSHENVYNNIYPGIYKYIGNEKIAKKVALSQFRISDEKGKIRGSGGSISERVILTNAHVINANGGNLYLIDINGKRVKVKYINIGTARGTEKGSPDLAVVVLEEKLEHYMDIKLSQTKSIGIGSPEGESGVFVGNQSLGANKFATELFEMYGNEVISEEFNEREYGGISGGSLVDSKGLYIATIYSGDLRKTPVGKDHLAAVPINEIMKFIGKTIKELDEKDGNSDITEILKHIGKRQKPERLIQDSILDGIIDMKEEILGELHTKKYSGVAIKYLEDLTQGKILFERIKGPSTARGKQGKHIIIDIDKIKKDYKGVDWWSAVYHEIMHYSGLDEDKYNINLIKEYATETKELPYYEIYARIKVLKKYMNNQGYHLNYDGLVSGSNDVKKDFEDNKKGQGSILFIQINNVIGYSGLTGDEIVFLLNKLI